jgi:cytidine deaminase
LRCPLKAIDSIKNRPPDELLRRYKPLPFWEEAVKQAMRSNHARHRTGAVIDYDNGAIAKGCSYKHHGGLRVNSFHAERHALTIQHLPPTHGKCIVVTLTKANNFAACSRPCYDCAHALQKRMVGVIYAEQTNDGGWAIREVPFDLLTEGYLKPTRYAT